MPTNNPHQEVLDLGIDEDPGPGRAGAITGKRFAVPWHVLTSVYARLGFDTMSDAAFAQLVLARIVEPTSKAGSLRVLDELGVARVAAHVVPFAGPRAGARLP